MGFNEFHQNTCFCLIAASKCFYIIKRTRNVNKHCLCVFFRQCYLQHGLCRGWWYFPVCLLRRGRLPGVERADLSPEGRRPPEVTVNVRSRASAAPFRPSSNAEASARVRPRPKIRLVGIVGQHGQCVSELCGLCGASCSPSTVVRLLQYYGSWAQLRDAFIGGWKPLGEVIGGL